MLDSFSLRSFFFPPKRVFPFLVYFLVSFMFHGVFWFPCLARTVAAQNEDAPTQLSRIGICFKGGTNIFPEEMSKDRLRAESVDNIAREPRFFLRQRDLGASFLFFFQRCRKIRFFQMGRVERTGMFSNGEFFEGARKFNHSQGHLKATAKTELERKRRSS